MTIKDPKHIVDLIKKQAQAADEEVGMVVPKGGPREKAAPKPVAAPQDQRINVETRDGITSYTSPITFHNKKPAGNSVSGLGNAAVKQLQQAIIDLANAASSTDLTSMQGDNTGRQMDAQNNFIDGSNPFGDFLVSNFVDTQGKPSTFTNTDVAGEKQRQEAKIENGRLKGIINSIKRIGTPGNKGGEQSVDGVWKSRTQSALENIYLLASGYLDFAEAVGVKLPGYSKADLAKLKTIIDAGYPKFKPNEISELAKKATAHMLALKVFFNSFNKDVVNNPKMKNQINQTKSFSQYKKAPVNMDVPEQFATNQLVDIGRPGLKRQLTLTDLKNLKNFKAWMIENDAKATDDDTVKRSLELIKIQLGVV